VSEDERPAEPRRSGWARRVRRALLWAGGLAAVLVVVVHLPPTERTLVEYALARLHAPIGADVSYQSIRYNLISRSVSIDGLRVGVPGQAPFVSAEHVSVRYPWTAYRGELDGLDITVEHADVTLVQAGRQWITIPAKWLAPRTSSQPPKPLPAFAALRLRNVGVHYEDRDAKFVSRTTGLTVDLLPTGSGRAGDLAGSLGPGARTEISWYPRGTALTLVGGRARYSPEGTGVDDLRVDAAEGTIRTNVAFTFHGADRLQLKAHGDLRGEALHTWLPLLDTLRGNLGVDFTLPSSKGAPAFADVAVAGKDVSWQQVLVSDFAASGALETGGISLDTMRAAVGTGTAQGNGRFAWEDAGQSHAVLDFRNMDAGRLWRTLLAKSPGALYVAPASIVGGHFEGNWTAWHAGAIEATLPSGRERGERLWLDGRVDARFRRGPWTIDVDARADGALAMHGTIETRGSEADYAQWPLGGTLALAGPVAPIVLDAFRYADLDASPEFANAIGDLTGTAELAQTFGIARASLSLHSDMTWPDQPVVAADLAATVDPSALQVTSFTASSGESKATGTTTIDFDRDTIDGRFAGSRIAVEAWTRRFGVDLPVSGPADVTGRVTGPLKTPVVDATVGGGPILVSGRPVSPVAAHVRYTDGLLTLDNISVTGPRGGQLTGEASWNADGGAISAALKASAFALDVAVPGLTTTADEAEGRIAASFDGEVHLGGTTESPAITADLRAPSLRLDAVDFGPLDAKITTADGKAHADVRVETLGTRLTGELGLSGARQFSAEFSVHSPDSPFAARVNGLDVSLGAVDLTAHASGSLQSKGLDAADLAVDRLDATVHQQPIAMAPGARVNWSPSVVEVSGINLSSGGAHLTASGRVDGQPGHSIVAQLTGQLEDLRPSVAPFMPAGTEHMALNGAFVATINAAGSVKAPVVTGALRLDDATVGDGLHPPVTGINVRAALDRDRLTLEVAEGHWQGAHAAIAGTVPARFFKVPGASPGGSASLTGHVDDVTIKVLEPFVSGDALKATDFNVKVEYTVAAQEPTVASAVADVRVVDASISSREVGITQKSPGHLVLRNGVATLDPWTLAGNQLGGNVTLAGSMTLSGTPTIDGRIDGQFDLRSLALVLGSSRPSGKANLSAAIKGPLATPNIDGFVTLENAELLIRDPRLLFADIHGTVRFSGDQMTVEKFAGALNGGALEASGSMRQPGRGTPSGSIAIKVSGALFDAPRGFRSMVDANLTLTGRRQDSRFTLGGTATIVEAAYRESLIVTGGLISLFQPKAPVYGAAPQRAAGPGPVTLNIQVLANDSIAIDTSYGRVSIGTNLRILGSPSNVRILGSADVASGGQFYFGGHAYQIQFARFEFTDTNSITPEIHMSAQTTVGGYVLTMRLDTVEGRVETRLNSDPPLPEDQIASLMVNGTRTSSVSPGDVVTQQLASALSGEITSAVGRAIGLDSVRIESGNPGDVMFDPSLISADSNPAQRLTFSKKVLPTLEVIVSQNLRESGEITYIVGWEVIPRLELRFVQLDNQDRSYEIRHDISFGGGATIGPVKKRTPEKVRDVFIATFGDIGEQEVRSKLRVTEGRTFDFYKWQEDRDKLEKLFLDRGYFQAQITARRDPTTPPASIGKEPTPVDLGYTIDEGAPTALVVTGMKIPGSLRDALIAAWTDTPVDSLLGDEFSRLIVPWMATKGYLKPTVTTEVRTSTGVKTAAITIEPGPRYTTREAVYTGNQAMSASDLKKAVKQSGVGERIWSSPSDLQTVLVTAYHTRGYLGAQVTIGNAAFEGNRATLPVQILEGPIFKVGVARVDDPGTPPQGVELTSPIPPGTVLTDTLVRDASRKLQQRYRVAGYRGTRVTAQSTARSNKTTVDLVFKVTRGDRAVLGTLTIAGVEGWERDLVDHLSAFTPGEPVSLDAINKARDRLYDTDLFRQVSIDTTARPAPDGQRQSGVMDATVSVDLLPKYRLQYGFQLFDPYRPATSPKWGTVDPGVVADLTRRGLFGRGITAGIAGRVNPSDRVARVYLSSRRFFGKPFQTNFYVGDEWQREISEAGLHAEQRTKDFTFDQRIRFRSVQLAYGYNFQKQDLRVTTDEPSVPEVQIKGNLSRLLGSIYFDRRDNVIDTGRGFFHSTSAEIAPEWLGSTAYYRKYLNQDFYFLPLPGSVVLASAARFELAAGPGQIFITSERLHAGGSTTVRGYDDVSLALIGPEALGHRTSLLVLNEELRIPIVRRLRGALFVDHASFFGDFNLPNLTENRTSAGVGVRFVLPFILLRVDYGYPLKQDPTNNHGRWYFAIGQAF
jgi:outer membrane protein assembly factor BamA/autotransporter translocation and assembly factor TamB